MLEILLWIWVSLALQDTNIVQGRVERGDTSEPVRGVEISLIAADSGTRLRTTSDTQGRFVFESLPFGRYTLQAVREGYFTYPQGQPLPSFVASVSVDATRTQPIVISLVPGAVIGGRISDPEGRPLQGVQVSAMKLQYDDGRPAFGIGSAPKTTDDRGEYRLFWFPPGEFYVRAEYPGGQGGLARRSYYPGTLDSSLAVPLVVRGGETFSGTNFTIPAVSTLRISGQVAFEGGGPASGVVRTFYLLPGDGHPAESYPLEFQNVARATPGQQSSSFALDIRGVPPGSYDLAPFYIDSAGTFHSGRTRIEIGNQDIDNVAVTFSPNVDVPGRFIFEGDTGFQKWNVLQLQLRVQDPTIPLMSRSSLASIAPDGTFVIRNVFEGRYHLYLGASPGSIPTDLYISGIRQGALDIRDEGIIDARASMLPLEITLRSGAGTIHGIVEAPGGIPPSHADVVLVPQMSRRTNLMFYDRTTVDDKGQFKFEGIAPGEYKVFAFDQLPDTAERNPAFIARYETLGQPVSVNSRSTTDIRVRLVR